MAPTVDEPELPLVAAQDLRPFASLMILQSTGPNRDLAVSVLSNRMTLAARKVRTGNRAEVVASGIAGAGGYLRTGADDEGIDEVWAFVYRTDREPSWSAGRPEFTDTKYELGLIIRRNDLIGIHCSGPLRSKLQNWLDRPPRPQLERVEPAILNGAFLTGEAKGLWLRGAQAPTAGRPDSKQITGRSVQASLNPFEDGGYALGSARVAFAGVPERALRGTVGTTPRNSIVWNRSTVSFDEFVAVTMDVLTLVEEIAGSGGGVEQPFRVLAQRATSLAGVSGAFDIVVSGADSLLAGPDGDEDLVDALAVLEHATLTVQEIDGSADFTIDVGGERGTAGSLRCSVVQGRSDFRLDIGLNVDRPATNPVVTREILDALRAASDQISVYYDSGHVFYGRSIWRRQIRNDPFPNWHFEDFTGYDITKEKPAGKRARDIHEAIAKDGDTSLFAWVVAHYSDGWLICDDGSGEVADFVYLSPEGELSLIHVKAAGKGGRLVSVGYYEEVTTQATKNLDHLDQDELYRVLASPKIANPACWTEGERVADRSEFLEQLRGRPARQKKFVVILQPHVSQALYQRVQPSTGSVPVGAGGYRLMQLETLLNANRGPVTGLGADLWVLSSQA
jgi:hypothetical protein